MTTVVSINDRRVKGKRDIMLYGHFIEHFHRQIYDGIFDPGNPLSDEDGFRTDIIDAMKKIRVPILRWPGGCFVSSYHWKDAVGATRKPMFDKAWRVEDPNTFGTDEYIKLCRKIGCEPYICTNAGTGTPEEMSDWVEYCNLDHEGQYAKQRIANGYEKPHKVKYWSIGNENYGYWEIGAKSADEWGRLVRESAKMMMHVDAETQLSAAALSDIDWNINLLKNCGRYLDWISIHQYWDMMAEVNAPAAYEECMAFTKDIARSVDDVRGILTAMTYTMADAVFAACFLNAMNRNCDIVGMANFAPILNTRGCIYSYDKGIVLRSTYHVFDLYVNYLGDTVIDLWAQDKVPMMDVRSKSGDEVSVDILDLLATKWSEREGMSLAAVNKHAVESQSIILDYEADDAEIIMYSITGKSADSYNDIDRNEIGIEAKKPERYSRGMQVELAPHSVNVLVWNLHRSEAV